MAMLGRSKSSDGKEPDGDADDPTGLKPTLKRTALGFRERRLTDWAAALTYYALLSLFPAVIALVSLIGLFGDPERTVGALTDIITDLGPETAAETFEGPIQGLIENREAAGIAFVGGLALALWSASGYVGAFIRASNSIYDVAEGRGFLKRRPLQIAITLAMILIMVLLALGLVMTGPIVRAVADPIGLGSTAVTIWNIGKWPVMAALFVTAISILYYASPNVKLRGFVWVTPGAALALVVWAITSAGFALYVANFGSYNETYGTLGGFVVLLMWFWITNLAILFGHQLNAERERSAELAEGRPGAASKLNLPSRENPSE